MTTISNWSKCSFNLKLKVLAGATFVAFDLLMENKDLVNLIKSGADKDACVRFINENF